MAGEFGNISGERAALRTRMRAARRSLGAEERAARSHAIAEHVHRLPVFRTAQGILIYLAYGTEVDTSPLFLGGNAPRPHGKRWAAPVTDPATRRLTPHWLTFQASRAGQAVPATIPGAFGIPAPDPSVSAPAALSEIDLVVVPGLAFDSAGHRLGYGGGYYDRFLARWGGAAGPGGGVTGPGTAPSQESGAAASSRPPGRAAIGLCYAAQLVKRVPVQPWDVAVDMVVTEDGWVATGAREHPATSDVPICADDDDLHR